MISAFRMHQKEFIEHLRQIASSDENRLEKCQRTAAEWSERLLRNGSDYRIWYDLRNQALFEPELRPVVEEMEDLQVAALAELVTGNAEIRGDIVQRIREFYLPTLGGLFHRFLQRIIFENPADASEQERAFTEVLERLLVELDTVSGRRSQDRYF